METETSSVHQRLLLTCAGGISATLLGLVAMTELLSSSQLLDATAASNEKKISTSTKCQSTKPSDGEENKNETNDSDNDLGEDQDVLENGEDEGKTPPTKDGANGGEDAGDDNGDGGSENSGDGGDDEDNDDGGSDENDEDDKENEEDNKENEEDVDEEDAEEDNVEGDEDEETLPPPKKRKK